METIAVYWEENIKTYGIQVEKDLCLARADILPSRLAALGQQITRMRREGTMFRLLLAHQFEPEVLSISMVVREIFREWLREFSARPSVANLCRSIAIDYPVEMLYFHGPHFGDRYGIAHIAGHALQKEDIRYIAMGCSAASVHLLFPEHTADKAKRALASVFHTP